MKSKIRTSQSPAIAHATLSFPLHVGGLKGDASMAKRDEHFDPEKLRMADDGCQNHRNPNLTPSEKSAKETQRRESNPPAQEK